MNGTGTHRGLTIWGPIGSSVYDLDHYGPAYPSDVAMMNAVIANLVGEAVEWVMKLHNKDAPELGNVEAFVGELRASFENESQALQAEVQI